MSAATSVTELLYTVPGREETKMATNVKQMLEAANAAVPKITPDQASDMIKKGNTLVLDVRDAPAQHDD